ncbi:uncharacterized protein, partial [Ambystoma mexicanum]|uniref:uncharacterized protein n=1 Tax=Ambystoma mexicanum TaxID=8296 RepID=UPI0037E9BF82
MDNDRTVNVVKRLDGVVTFDPMKINAAFQSYYKTLYSSETILSESEICRLIEDYHLKKEGRPPVETGSYKPISLLNTDNKILAKALALRIEASLMDIIDVGQSGFVKGRHVSDNMRRLLLTLYESRERQNDVVTLSLDAEKAFDHIEWTYLLSTLKGFGFGDNMIGWIRLLYSHPMASVRTNGMSSGVFELERGTRQGCPLSPILFVIAMELLALRIREEDRIQGVRYGAAYQRVWLYADDMLLVVQNVESSILVMMEVIGVFIRESGYKINWVKSEALPASTACTVLRMRNFPSKPPSPNPEQEAGIANTIVNEVSSLPAEYHSFRSIFSQSEFSELPPHRRDDCAIDLIPDRPLPFGRMYILSAKEKEVLKKYLHTHIKNGLISESTSPAAASLFFIPKKDTTELRPCIDFRGLNKITIPDKYPMPLIPDILEAVQGAKVYTKLDLRGAYHLIRIKAGDEWKTAFRTPFGHYQYRVMPFGLMNAPAVFQRFMDHIFADISLHYVIIYLDDILIFSSTWEEHVLHVKEVLTRLQQNHLFCKLEKCEFHKTTISYLGYVLAQQGIAMDPDKISAITEWPSPRSIKDIQRFLGFANFYRRFIPHFSLMTKPLTYLLKKDIPFVWAAETQRSFEQLKILFTQAPILQVPDQSRRFIVESDASQYALGAVLLQPDEQNIERPVAYLSKTLSPAELHYTVLEKELLAIKRAFEEWRHLLLGAQHPIEVRTDHHNLRSLQYTQTCNSRQARWAYFFSPYRIKFTFVSGNTNLKADALSRKTPQEKVPFKSEPMFPRTMSISVVRLFLQRLENKSKDLEILDSTLLSTYGLTRSQGLLFKGEKVYIPDPELQKEVLRLCHDSQAAGHRGFTNTLELIQRHFWWPSAIPGLTARQHEFTRVFNECTGTLPWYYPWNRLTPLAPPAPLRRPNCHHSKQQYLDQYLANGFIRPSKSPASSALFFVPKKEGDLRTCIDYRALNQITVKNRYPLPLIPELLDQVKDACIYTKLDLRGAYHLVRIKEGDEWKTAFRTKYGLFEYQVMPFGLCNAPAAFQYFMNDVLRELIDVCVVVYIDDILVYSSSEEEHQRHVKKVLERLRQHSLFAKLEKCVFNATEVEFLGFILSPNGVHMDSKKVDAIIKWPSPTSVKGVQSMLGFANFYRRFIPEFSRIVQPITALLKKNKRFEWSSEAEQAFQDLKAKFISAPVLKHPRPELPYIMETDASSLAMGAVLSQRDSVTNQLHPVAFWSRKFSPPEINYSITDKELLAIRSAFKAWRHYLLGARHTVTVMTDHRNLQYLKTAKAQSSRQLRWALFLAEFDFLITYRPGSKNGKADALSRMGVDEHLINPDPIPIIPEQRILGLVSTQSFEDIKTTVKSLLTPTDLQDWQLKGKDFSVDQDLPYFRGRLHLPCEKLQKQVISGYHDSLMEGHPGITKTMEKIKRHFWWPSWKRDIRDFVISCGVCAQNKSQKQRPAGLLQPLDIPPCPWHTLSMDFIRIVFDVIKAPQFQIILGIPWLEKHNPQIDWRAKTVQFPECSTTCYPRPDVSLATISSEEILKLPPEYQEFQDVFQKDQANTLPPHRSYDCQIDLIPGTTPPCSRIYALTEPENLHLRQYLDQYLANGFIRPSKSPASSALFFVPKKEGDLRTCIDYRALNQITVKNRYPLPLIPELLDQVKDACIYTKLDLRGAYHLVRIKEGDEWKTAFRTKYGLFEYQVMPFGLCNAPAAFQYFMNDVLRELIDVCVVVYIDDILVYSSSEEEHQRHVKKVLERLRQHSLFAKLEKCVFNATEVEFLGFILSPNGVHMDSKKVDAIIKWPSPTSVKGVQSMLGFGNFYRRFIPEFSRIVQPITALLKKNKRFEWSSEAEQAFQDLKAKFISAPVLKHPRPELPYIMETDASSLAMGAVLSQRDSVTNQLHPVAFWSRKFSPPEINYSITDKELLAIRSAFKAWRHYLLGARHTVTVMTDHRNLQYLKTAKAQSSRQLRWALFLAEFDFLITYRPGSKNGKADALSRMGVDEHLINPDPIPIIPEQRILGLVSTQSFEDIKTTVKSLLTPTDLQDWQLKGKDFSVDQDLPYFRGRLHLPCEKLQKQVISGYHDSLMEGHPGITKTMEKIKRHFWWPSWKRDIRDFVISCGVCAQNKSQKQRPAGLLQPLDIPPCPWHTLSMDFI